MCGDIIEGETSANAQVLDYRLDVRAGTVLNGRVEPIGSTFNVAIRFLDSNNREFASFNDVVEGVAESFQNFAVSSSNSTLQVTGALPGWTGTGQIREQFVGAFTIYLGCTLRDGTVIPAGGQPPSEVVSSPQPIPQQPVPNFGLPAVGPIDFSAGIEIPFQLGQTQVAPIGGDVALYTYEASAGSTATLSVARVSGDISIGVTVIQRDNNEVIFLGGMPSSDQLSVQLTFPSDGTYAIGLFRLDTPTKSGTSGAVQISIN